MRVLKASTKDKTVWQPEVATLLDLKKKLEQCLVSTDDVAPTPPAQNGLASDSEIERLQESVDQQVYNFLFGSCSTTFLFGLIVAGVVGEEVERKRSGERRMAAAGGTPVGLQSDAGESYGRTRTRVGKKQKGQEISGYFFW